MSSDSEPKRGTLEMPLTLEIEFESRWLTTVGTLNLTLGAAGFRTRSFDGPRLRL